MTQSQAARAARHARATELFLAAVEVPEEARDRFLGQACGPDRELRSAVERLLGADAAGTDFLAPAPPVAADLPETQVGPYRLVRVLGSGGMGTVWLAERDDGQFRQRVALKLVKRGMDTDAVVRRFRVERQVLADLEHPRIARLLDGGSTEHGLPYLVMELVEGRPLLAYCADEGLGVEERLRLFQKMCETVQFAHERQVVHRDLKPSNVLVTAQGEPKLLDFGIAKVLEAGQGPELELTRTGERFLSPRYASPEQLRGAPVGPASDVYALGVILYELLTALHPHAWMTTSWSEFELDVLQRDPSPPSRAVLVRADVEAPPEGRRARSRRLRGDLDTIVLTALRKEPERRYASAHALALDLGRHLAGHPVHARPDTLPYRAAKYVQRNRGLVAGAGAFVLLLSIALAVTLILYRDSLRAEHAAQWEAYVGHVAAAASALEGARSAEARAHLELAHERLRGWEWEHLRSRLDRSLRTLRAPHGMAIALDPAGGRLALPREREIEIRELATLELLQRLEPVGPLAEDSWKGCIALAFAGETGRLASVWHRGELVVHDLNAGGRVAWRGEAGVEHTSLAFDPTGRRLFVGTKDGRLRVHDPAGGVVLTQRGAHAKEIGALAFDPTGTLLASGGWDDVARIWRADRLELLHELRGHAMAVHSVAFAPDGVRLVSTSLDGTLHAWDVESGGLLQVHHLERGFEGAALYSGADDRLLIASRGVIHVLDARTFGRLAMWHGHDAYPTALALDPLRGRAWTRAGDDVKEWDLATEDVRVLRSSEFGGGACFDPEGRRIASTGPDRRIRLWAWPTAQPLGELTDDQDRLMGLAFHPTEDRLHTLDAKGRLSTWDPGAGRLLHRGEPAERLTSAPRLAAARSGELLCFLGVVLELRSPEGALVRRFASPRDEVLTCASLDSETRLVAAGAASGATLVWAADGAEPRRLAPPWPSSSPAFAVAQHAGRLATGHGSGAIALREAASGRTLAVMEEGRVRIDALAFHPDGRRLASGSMDGTIRLWDVETGRLVVTLGGHTVRVSALEFSSDGATLLSSSDDGTLRLWEIGP